MLGNVICRNMENKWAEAEKLAGSSKNCPSRRKERLLSPISTGFFLILVGIIFIFTPNLFESILAFLKDLTFRPVPNSGISLPSPGSPVGHFTVYLAVQRFSLLWGLFQALVLALRFAFHSLIERKAESLSSIVFWLGSAFLIQRMLVETTRWFEYWAAIIILIGLSLIVRAVFLVAYRGFQRRGA